MLQRASFSLPKEPLVCPTFESLCITASSPGTIWSYVVIDVRSDFEKSHFCNINVVSLTLIVLRQISYEIYQSTSRVLWCGTGDSVCNAGGDYREGNGTL